LGNYVAWFAATLVFTAFHRLDGPGPRGFIQWFEAKCWLRYVPGMIAALAVMTIVGTTLYFLLGAFVRAGNLFLHIPVDQQVWQFSAIGLILAIAGIVVFRGRHYGHDEYTGLFWLPQFTIFGVCAAIILFFNWDLLVVGLLFLTGSIAIAVWRWEPRSERAKGEMPTKSPAEAPAEVIGT
jgi:hypothetical protein